MSALALISDLMMQSQASAAARAAGVELRLVLSEDALVELAQQQSPRLVIVDLSHPGVDPAGLVGRLGPLLSPECRLLAFGPHVHKGRLEAAASAGFEVISRGQFHAQLDEIVRGAGCSS